MGDPRMSAVASIPNLRSAPSTISTTGGDPDVGVTMFDDNFLDLYKEVDRAVRHRKLCQVMQHHKTVVLDPSKRGANLSGDPVVSIAIAVGKTDVAIWLIRQMSLEELTVKNLEGDTPLHVAAQRGDTRAADAIIAQYKRCVMNGKPTSPEGISTASAEEEKEVLPLLGMQNTQQETPLHKAALYGQITMFQKLVKYGSNPNARGWEGASVLHCALMGNACKLALYIAREHKDLIYSRNDAAVTPLQLMVTIPKAFRSKQSYGSIKSWLYRFIPLSDAREKPKGILRISAWRIKMIFLQLWKKLSKGIEGLEKSKQNHEDAKTFIAYVAKDEKYWDFLLKGRKPKTETEGEKEAKDTKPTSYPTEKMSLSDFLSHISKIKDRHEEAKITSLAEQPLEALVLQQAFMDTLSDFQPRLAPFTIPGSRTASANDHSSSSGGKDDEKTRWDKVPIVPATLIPRAKAGIRNLVKEIVADKEIFRDKDKDYSGKDHEKQITRWDETPLILGAKMGLHEFVEMILKERPESAMITDFENKSFLQVAIQHGHLEVVRVVQKMATGPNPMLPSWLLSAREAKTKNTILHFAAEKTMSEEEATFTQMQYELQWFERVKKMVPRDMRYSRNISEKTAQELFTENHRLMVKNAKDGLQEFGKTGASMVAAVVFASSFSIPGDRNQNTNVPIYHGKTAFKVYSHTYVIGLSCATTAMLLFFSLWNSPYREQHFRRSIPTKYFFASLSFFLTLVFLLASFVCNIYLNIYGWKPAESSTLIPMICELVVFPAVCLIVLLYQDATWGITPFLRKLWR